MTERRSNQSALRLRPGFTLAELLVSLALIALLAAVLIPTVAGQLLKGDAGRVTSDLNAVQAGIESFLADVHRYPGKYSDLTKLITTTASTHKDILGNAYTAGLVSKWKGPYVTKDTLTINSIPGVVPTGFGGYIVNALQSVAHTNGVNYVTVVIAGISSADFDKLDDQVDGTTGGTTTGLLRWVTGGASNIDTVKFLAIPIQ
jgi:prepilin-type N-terminal cleavage/methylation domain-containing protein